MLNPPLLYRGPDLLCSYGVSFGSSGTVCCAAMPCAGREPYQWILRVKYMAAATARNRASDVNVLNGALPPQSNSLRCPMTPLPRFPVIRENSRAPQLRSRRLRIQHGSLALVSRKEGPAAWQFRWSEKDLHGARVQRKRVIGTVERYLDEARARSAIAVLLAEINSDKVRMGSRSINVAQLCDHFQQLELARDNTWRSYSTKETYQAYLTRWVLPHWRHFELAEVRTIQETREPLWNPCRKQSK